MFKYDPHFENLFFAGSTYFWITMKTTKFLALQKNHAVPWNINPDQKNFNVLHGQMISKYIQSKDISQLSPGRRVKNGFLEFFGVSGAVDIYRHENPISHPNNWGPLHAFKMPYSFDNFIFCGKC